MREHTWLKVRGPLVVAIAICLGAGSISSSAQQSATATTTTPSWPRVFDRNGTHVVVYQPQLKAWQRYRELVADTAVSITDKGQQPILGVISWHAQTITDQSAQTVYVSNIVVLDARFPSLDPAQAAATKKRVEQFYPTMTLTIGLPRMIASLEHLNQPVRSVAASTQPPKILVSTVPAIVLLVDGKPVLAPIQGTTLQYVVNTNFDLFYDNSDYYLLSGRTWLKAHELRGPWVGTLKLPPDMANLPTKQNWDEVLKAVPPAARTGTPPNILFTDKPAELIAFSGKPI